MLVLIESKLEGAKPHSRPWIFGFCADKCELWSTMCCPILGSTVLVDLRLPFDINGWGGGNTKPASCSATGSSLAIIRYAAGSSFVLTCYATGSSFVF